MLCHQNNSQLVVVDLQSTLLNTMQADDKNQLLKNTNVLITSASLLDIPVFITEQYPKGLGKTDAALSRSIGDAPVYEKTRFSCLGASEFDRQVANSTRNQYIICGIEAHVCVLQTALELIALGKDVFVVQDAVCSRSGLNKENALIRIRQCSGIISNVESVLFEWLKDSKHEHFKKISALIR